MSDALKNTSTAVLLSNLQGLFGPPPVLSTENQKAYEDMLAQLIECHRPQDVMEQILIRQLVDSTWEIIRYARHKILVIDRRFRARLEFQAKRTRQLAQLKEAKARELAERNMEPATALNRFFDLDDAVLKSAHDIDVVLTKPPDELDHARALEGALDYYERLDKLLNIAIGRRNDALEQLEHYREGLGARLRQASAEIIDVESTIVEAQPEQEAQPDQIAWPALETSGETTQVAARSQEPTGGTTAPVAPPQETLADGMQAAEPAQVVP
jgi:hypothetical protein